VKRSSLRNRRCATITTDDDWTCIYGDHPIPAGEPYIAVNYERDRWDGRMVTPAEVQDLFYACMQHAPSQDTVIKALQSAGIPVVPA
jgi:hypothetical protein